MRKEKITIESDKKINIPKDDRGMSGEEFMVTYLEDMERIFDLLRNGEAIPTYEIIDGRETIIIKDATNGETIFETSEKGSLELLKKYLVPR